MTRRISTLGMLALCAAAMSVAFWAFAAAGASASDRAWTCKPVTTGATFSDQHCLTAKAGGEGWTHELITATTANKTPITVTNEKTASSTTASSVQILKGALSGVETEVKCAKVANAPEEEALLWNDENATGKFASATGRLHYTGCEVTKPARECKVKNGTILTNKLLGTTEKEEGTGVVIKPDEGTEFTAINIEGCKNNVPAAGAYPVTGSLTVKATGATLSATHEEITKQGTLLFGGNVTGIEGAITVSMKEGNPITLTP